MKASAPPPISARERHGAVSRRWLLAFALAVPALCLALTALVLRTLLVERPPTPLPVVEPPLPALTQHLVLYVLDGLRYDYATDPSRAPQLAKRMATGASGRVIAGQITMTSAAVISFGTGARGDFAQVVTNLSVARTRQNDLFANARARGLRTALVGDRTWLDAFGDDGFSEAHTDATGLALDVDNSPEMFAEAEKVLLAPDPPRLTVVHFLATDHFGHAFGTEDPRYLAMLARFDARLGEHLDKLGPDVTVVVLSDHGATATGAHGSDIWSVRQTPLYAAGPGIRRDARGLVFEQVHVAATLATLVGVPVPAESRGTVQTGLLDLTDVQIAAVRAAEAKRVTAAVGAEAGASPVETYDRAIVAEKESRGLSASLGIVALMLVGLLAAGAALPELLRVSRAVAVRWATAVFAVALASILLTKYVELVVPPFHNVIRAVLFVIGNAVLLLWAFRASSVFALATRWPITFFALVPGAIVVSYTANTQPEAFASAAALLLSALCAKERRTRGLCALALFVLGYRFAYVNEDPFPGWLASRTSLLAAASFGGLVAYGLLTPLARAETFAKRGLWLIAPALGLFGATHATPAIGIAATLLLPVGALVAFLRGEKLGARNLVLAAFLLLSRDVEVLPVLALATLAELGGPILEGHQTNGIPRLVRVAAWTLVLFGLTFLGRVAIQRGLDFDRLHFGAGAFGSSEPNKIWVGVMMGYRYALVSALFYGAALAHVSAAARPLVGYAALVAWFARAATLCTMLVFGRTSYWTAQRTMSDVSPALITSVVLALAMLVLVARSRPLAAPQ